MKSVKLAVVGAVLLLGAAGCGRTDGDEALEGMPEYDDVAMEISGGADEGLSQALQQGLAGQPPELLLAARASVKALNERVRATITALTAVANQGQGQAVAGKPNVVMYGPRDEAAVTYRLFIRKVSTDQKFAWRLEAKALGAADDSYQVVMAGRIDRKAGAATTQGRRAKGGLGVNLDVVKAIDPAFKGQGILLAGFGRTAETRTVAYRLKNFSPNTDNVAPVNAAYVGHKAASGLRRVRLAGLHNLAQSATAAKELVRLRVRHLPGVGGRADGLATGGDVPTGKVWRAVACWDAADQESFQRVFECTPPATPGSCTVMPAFSVGDVSACHRDFANDETPPEDAENVALEDGAPEGDIVPPAEMPNGEE